MANNTKGKKESQKKNRSRRPRNNGRPKEMEVNIKDSQVNEADIPKDPFGNDITWYTHYPELAATVANINYGYPVGSAINWNFQPISGLTMYEYLDAVAGIMTIHFIPSFGDLTSGINAPLNKVGNQLFAVMRIKLSTSASYDPADIEQYLISMDSAYLLYALGVKIYGILNMSSPFNDYFLGNLCTSLGVNFNSFRANMAQFRAVLNEYAIFLASRLVPADFDLFKRHIWMLTNIFADSEEAKAQLYHYMIDGIYIYTDQIEGPAQNVYTPLISGSETVFTFERFQTLVQDVLNSLLNSTPISTMSTDIGKAFPDTLFRVNLIPEDYQTPIGYSPEVLSQIENCTLIGSPALNADHMLTAPNMNITEHVALDGSGTYLEQSKLFDNQMMRSYNVSDKPAWLCITNKMINMHIMQPTYQDTLVATRGTIIPKTVLTVTPQSGTEGPTTYALEIGACGTEIYTQAMIFKIKLGTGVVGTPLILEENLGDSANAYRFLQIASYASQFDWAPQFNVFIAGNGSWTTVNRYRFQDIDNYGMMDAITLGLMHRNCLLSELYSDQFINAHVLVKK